MPAGLPGLPTDALAGYHFSIEFDGVTIAQFQEVSGLTSELDVIELKQNTPDGKYVIHKLPGNRKPPSITLKRGKNGSKDLWDWHEKIIQVTPASIEGLFASDLAFLQDLYRRVNSEGHTQLAVSCPNCRASFTFDMAGSSGETP